MVLTETNPRTQPQSRSDFGIPESVDSAIVFGHADGDGHLAAVQTCEWLARKNVSATTVVSSATSNYLFWGRLHTFDLTGYDLIVIVDIAFRFRDPCESLSKLTDVSDQQPDKQFIAIDHHPFVRPQPPRRNVLFHDVTDPYDCCLGDPDPELMQVAAICDGGPTRVVPTRQLRKRALGVKRAAADVHGVAGEALLELIKQRQWALFESLADEDQRMHLSARGRRRRLSQASPLLDYARSLATSWLSK